MKSKSILFLLLALVLVFSLLPVTPAQAEGKSYDFMVGGVSVTGDNAADILGDGLFSYDAETNTLTVKGSKDFSVNAVVNNNPSLTIFVANDATLTSSGCTTLLSFCDFTVTGPGKLTLKPVNSTKADAVFLHAGTMTLEDADVRASGVVCGIEGGNTAKLVVRNSFLTASGDAGGIAYLADFTVEGCKLITPYNGKIVSSGVLAPEDSYESFASHVRIDPIRYDLWIAGTQAAETNREDILGDGAFSYDPDTKTLTVRGDLNRTGSLIVNNIDGLTIYVAKDAVLDTDDAAITTGKDLRITGPGKLGLLANFGVKAMYDATVTLQNANVSAVGYYPITGGLSGTNKLIIQNSDVVSTGITAAVSGFKGGIELIDCTLIKPEDGKVGERAIENADGSVATQVTIRKKAEYDLQIGGVKVDEGNASDILADGGFSYDAAENTLTVRGNYTGTGQGIVNSIPNLTVYVEKDAKLSAGGAALITRENLTITGPGKLTLESSTDCGIYAVNGAAVTIEKSTLDASGEWGIAGNHTGEKLILRACDVHAEGADGAICDFVTTVLDGCEITAPEGGKVDATSGNVLDKDGNLALDVTIETPKYDLWIIGRQVSGSNACDVLYDGLFSYDAEENTLTVRGDCSSLDQIIINNGIPDLTVFVAEDASLGSAFHAIETAADLTINGPGLLMLSSINGHGFFAHDSATVTIENANVYATGQYGISGYISGEKLIIRNSDVYAAGRADHGAISRFFGGITLSGCSIIDPVDGTVTGSEVVDQNGDTALEVTIEKKLPKEYDLWIDGTAVTEANAEDVLNNGVFSYDAETNTLILSGNYTAASTWALIQNMIPDLTISVSEKTVLNARFAGILSTQSLTVTGPGKLTVKSESDCAIYATNGATLKLEAVNVNASGMWGIAGSNYGEKLEIEGSTVYANGSSGAICDFDGGIDLIGCEIFEPAGGKVKDGAIVDGSGVLPYEAIIKVEGASGLPCSGGEDCPGNVFTDMPAKGNWAHDAIDWAIVYKVTTGTSATTFSPNAGCTRAQVVTFLWRAAGEPEPTGTSNPFTDVKEGAYYYKAVLWAVENKVTTGTSTTTFSPDATCTRAQIVTFLWRFEGEPASSTTTNPFTDVKAGAYYEKAVLWASETGVTAGTSATTFSPDDTCTRAQVVTFLYRDIESSDQ